MKKVFLIGAIALLVTGCNYDMIDTNYSFDKAICLIEGEYRTLEIDEWKDYEDGEQIQIQAKDGKTYLVSANNCTLIKE